jgi:DNA-binding response OmpR family regulator
LVLIVIAMVVSLLLGLFSVAAASSAPLSRQWFARAPFSLSPLSGTIIYVRVKRLLLVDDDLEWLAALSRAMRNAGYDVETAHTGAEAVEAVGRRAFDCVLLDWELPDAEGVSVCRWLRDLKSRGAILMVTGRDRPEDQVLALDSGADDFMSKAEFRLEVALARVAAVIRRTTAGPSAWRAGDLTLDEAGRTVTIGATGETVRLTPTELQILALLAKKVGRVVSRAEIMAVTWGERNDVSENAVETVVRRLRQKLGEAGESIETMRGAGYRLRGA